MILPLSTLGFFRIIHTYLSPPYIGFTHVHQNSTSSHSKYKHSFPSISLYIYFPRQSRNWRQLGFYPPSVFPFLYGWLFPSRGADYSFGEESKMKEWSYVPKYVPKCSLPYSPCLVGLPFRSTFLLPFDGLSRYAPQIVCNTTTLPCFFAFSQF